jgi:hypothetical protein
VLRTVVAGNEGWVLDNLADTSNYQDGYHNCADESANMNKTKTTTSRGLGVDYDTTSQIRHIIDKTNHPKPSAALAPS